MKHCRCGATMVPATRYEIMTMTVIETTLCLSCGRDTATQRPAYWMSNATCAICRRRFRVWSDRVNVHLCSLACQAARWQENNRLKCSTTAIRRSA